MTKEIREKALQVIEYSAANAELWDYYEFAHIALGHCSNAHRSWVEKLERTYDDLKLRRVI